MQVDADSIGTIGSGIVKPAGSTYDGAFGAVQIAQPYDGIPSTGGIPPIVSPEYAINNYAPQQQPMTLPPIVSPFKATESGAQSTSSLDYPGQAENPEGFANRGENRQVARGMLAPMVPSIQPGEFPESNAPMAYSPAPVIQASMTPVDSELDTTFDNTPSGVPQNHLAQGISAAGVPLYPQALPVGYTSQNNELPPIVQGDYVVSPVDNPEIAQAASSTPMPPVISSESQVVYPKNPLATYAPSPLSSTPMNSAPMVLASSPMPMTSAQVPNDTMNSVMVNQGQSYFSNPPMEAPVYGSGSSMCSGCGGAGCPECGVAGTALGDVAGCQSCGPGGCFNGDDVTRQFNACGSVSWARRYLIVDALYIDRYDGTVAVTNFGGLNNFEDDLYGARITLGRREDAANGDELVYFGTAKMSQSAVFSDPAGRIFVGGFPGPGDTFGPETTAFRNAVEQAQKKQTMFQSVEFNKNDWGWDVMRTFVGLRYIYVQDEFAIASRNLADETGQFELTTQNNLIGPQIGYELFYDVGYRLSCSTIGKFGIYANPNAVKTKLFNAGAQFLDLSDHNVALGGTIELGLQGQYKLSERSRFRFGYTAFWLGNVAGVSDNIPASITPSTGSDTSDSGEMFFNGLSVGFEIFR